MSIEGKILREIDDLFKVSGPNTNRAGVVLAVSGGPDSVALLLLMAKYSLSTGLKLHIAHVDHGLRGQESKRDANFVAQLAQSLGIAVSIKKVDAESHRARRGISLEEAARELRYNALAQVVYESGADAVMVGHTSDDQVETVIMHILRGTGLAGLAGMSKVSYWNSELGGSRMKVIRPLLGTSREETVAYCSGQGVVPREDSTNRLVDFTRNKIRLDLLPQLRQYNSQINGALLRLSEASTEDYGYIAGQANLAREYLVLGSEHGFAIERKGFLKLASSIKRQLVRILYQDITGHTRDLSHYHLKTIAEMSEMGTGKEVALPQGVVFCVDYNGLRLVSPPSSSVVGYRVVYPQPLKIPGCTVLPSWEFEAKVIEGKNLKVSADKNIVVLDHDQIGDDLFVRTRRPGDRIQPFGMRGSKKVQDIMVDAKIPRRLRDQIPIVVSDKGIVWIAGHVVADWARLRENSDKGLQLVFSGRRSI